MTPVVEKDHPRLRGNYDFRFKVITGKEGSPPLTRELPLIFNTSGDLNRITPAYAGTTIQDEIGDDELEDHPRLRGNYCLDTLWYTTCAGSPPLTRELLLHYNE